MKKTILLLLVVFLVCICTTAWADNSSGKVPVSAANGSISNDNANSAPTEQEKDALLRENSTASVGHPNSQISQDELRKTKELEISDETPEIQSEEIDQDALIELHERDARERQLQEEKAAFNASQPGIMVNTSGEKGFISRNSETANLSGNEEIELILKQKAEGTYVPPPSESDKPDGNLILQGGESCADAAVITSLPYNDTGTTSGALNDLDEVCPYSGGTAPDVVYSYTPAADMLVDVSLCGSSYDTRLWIYAGTCDTGNRIACNDDDCGLQSMLHSVPLTAGETYYIVVDGYSSSSGAYVIDVTEVAPPPQMACCMPGPVCNDMTEADCIAAGGVWHDGELCSNGYVCPTPPSNDECTGAIVLGNGDCYTADNTANNYPDCPGDLGWAAQWFEITLPYAANAVTINLCDLSGLANWAGVVYYPSCPVDCPNYILFDNYFWTSGGCNGNYLFTLQASLVGPGSIFVPAWMGDASQNSVDFEICVSVTPPPVGRCCYDNLASCDDLTEVECLALPGNPNWAEGLNCNDNPCPSTSGNDCNDPIIVDLGAGLPYTELGQTTCGRMDDYFDTCLGSYDGGEDIIYAVTVATEDDYLITMDPGATTWTGILITDVCPPSTSCIAYQTGVTGVRTLNVHLTPGVYYIMVDTWPSPDCIPSFNLTIDTYVPPTGRCCYNYYNSCDDLTEAACLALAGAPEWTEGLSCGVDPCVMPPVGRCCFDYFASCANMIQLECLDQAGSPQWTDGITCESDPCPVPPPGDFCSDPFVIPENFPFYDANNTCGFTNLCDITGSDNSDVIYEMVLANDYDLTISLCGSSYDTKLAVFSEACCTGAGTEFAYNDDFCSLQSQIQTFFPAGTYYVVVDGFSSQCGDYTLSVDIFIAPVGRCCYNDYTSCDNLTEGACLLQPGNPQWAEGLTCEDNPCPTPPPNEDCTNAIALTDPLPISVSGSTQLAINDYDVLPGEPACWQGTWFTSSGAGPDVTYTWVVPNDGQYSISLCGSSFDTALLLYSNNCPPIYPDDFICGNDDACGLQSELILDLLAGQDLLIIVDGYGSNSGDYTLEIRQVIGACCVDLTCEGTMSQAECDGLGGTWYIYEDCATFDCESAALCADRNDVVYGNGDADGSNGLSMYSAPGQYRSILDDITVPDGGWVVNGFHQTLQWYSGGGPEATGYDLILWDDAGGAPGAVIQTLTATVVSEVPTGRIYFGRPDYIIGVSFDDLTLDPGTYWLEMHVIGPENAFANAMANDGNGDEIIGAPIWVNYEDYGGLQPGINIFGSDYGLNFCLTFAGGGGPSPCGDYVVGDFNNDNFFNVTDITNGFSQLKSGTSPNPPVLCTCIEGHFPPDWAVAMDVNGNCAFNVADITDGFKRLKLGRPQENPCPECAPESWVGGVCCYSDNLPPCDESSEQRCNAAGGTWYIGEDCDTFTCPGPPSPRDGNTPMVIPNLESKMKVQQSGGME